MQLDWMTYTLDEWNLFDLNDWITFVLVPATIWEVVEAQVYSPRYVADTYRAVEEAMVYIHHGKAHAYSVEAASVYGGI